MQEIEILQLVHDSYPGLVIVHDLEGHIISLNPRAMQLFTEEDQPISPSLLTDLILSDARQDYTDYLRLIREKEEIRGRYSLKRPKGETMIYKYFARHLNVKGPKKLVVIYALDVTRLFNAEKDLELANRMSDLNLKRLHKTLLDLEKAREIADKSINEKEEFLARMSHEIRTPLNGIIGFSEILLRNMPDSPERKYAEIINKSSHHLSKLVNDILDFSKLDSGVFTIDKVSFSLYEIAHDLLGLFEFNVRQKGVSLEFSQGCYSRIPLLGDAGRIMQILVNLVSNALKFTEQGTVSIAMEMSEETGQKAKVIFEVSDTGIGIPEELIPYVFESYKQVHADDFRKFGGTGLGLSICRQLAAIMGGQLKVDSKEGIGSRFYFELMLEKDKVQPFVVPKLTSKEKFDLSRKKILIAEDNDINLLLAEKIISDSGAIVTSCTNGRDAVSLAKAGSFDVILLDIQMPLMDGIEAGRLIREFTTVPLVATSAHVNEREKRKCREAGIEHYLTKPINPDVLISTLGNILENREKESIILQSKIKLSENLHNISDGDEVYMQGIMKLIRSKIPEMLLEAEERLNMRDWVRFKKACHKILPNAKLMNLPGAAWLQLIEEQKRSPESWSDCEKGFQALKEQCMDLIEKM